MNQPDSTGFTPAEVKELTAFLTQQEREEMDKLITEGLPQILTVQRTIVAPDGRVVRKLIRHVGGDGRYVALEEG